MSQWYFKYVCIRARKWLKYGGVQNSKITDIKIVRCNRAQSESEPAERHKLSLKYTPLSLRDIFKYRMLARPFFIAS